MDPVYPNLPNQPKTLPVPKESRIAVMFFGCFILLAIGLVVFFYYQNQELKKMLAKYATPSPTPSPIATTDPLPSWKTYTSQDNVYQFRFPQEWNNIPPADSSNKVIFQSTDGLYRFTVESQLNRNKVTGKAYESLDQFIGLPYTVKTITIDNHDARQPLPKAGMENFDKAYLFSPDEKSIFSLELLVGDGSMADHRVSVESLRIGESIFNQIISTFKFISPSLPASPVSTDLPKGSSSSGVYCTQEAKLCPDGSFVSKTGPNCEFAPCPSPVIR